MREGERAEKRDAEEEEKAEEKGSGGDKRILTQAASFLFLASLQPPSL